MDLKAIQKEINERKQMSQKTAEALGEQKIQKQSGNQFLKELMYSKDTGQETNASKKVKAVDMLAESKSTGKKIDDGIMNHLAKPAENKSNSPQREVRTAAIDAKLEEQKRLETETYHQNFKSKNDGLADAISQYYNTPSVGAPMNNSILTEEEMLKRIQNGQNFYPKANSGSSILTEQAYKVAKEMLNENFGTLYAEAMKNNIIETYKREVIKDAINENRSFIEQIVRETIIDLQRKSQKTRN